MNAGIGDQDVQFRLERTNGPEWKDGDGMQCETCWLRTILAYVRQRKSQQGAQIRFLEQAVWPHHELSKNKNHIIMSEVRKNRMSHFCDVYSLVPSSLATSLLRARANHLKCRSSDGNE